MNARAVALLLLLLAACSGASGGSGPPGMDRLAVGDQATFRLSLAPGQPFEQVVDVIQASPSSFTRRVTSGASAQVITFARVGAGEYIASTGVGDATSTFTPPSVLLPANLAPGAVESTTSTVSSAAGTSTVVRTATVVGTERVTVPAGTFDAIKVTTAIVPSSGASSTLVAWWAPGVGRVRSVSFPDATPSNTLTSELVAYAAPVAFSPPAGVFEGPLDVALSTSTPDARIVYTLDGSEPGTGSPAAPPTLRLPASTTVKAAAVVEGRVAGPSTSARYLVWGGPSIDATTSCAALSDEANRLRRACTGVHPALLVDPAADPACASLAAEVARGRVRYDGVAAHACVVAAQALGCAGLTREGTLLLPPACDAMLAGTVGYAGECTATKDCISGVCTSDVHRICPGACLEFANVGQPCSNGPCPERWACDQASGYCAPASGLGGPCPCHPGFWCDGSGAAPACAALLPAGGVCASSVQCAAGTTCVTSCPVDNAACTDPGTCQPVVGVGGGCGAGGPSCADGYWCSSGTCVPWPAVGQACVGGGIGCLGGGCAIPGTGRDNLCVAGQADGGSCFRDDHCASGFCNTFTQRCQSRYCLP